MAKYTKYVISENPGIFFSGNIRPLVYYPIHPLNGSRFSLAIIAFAIAAIG